MAAGDVWGNSWGASWGNSWALATEAPQPQASSGGGPSKHKRYPRWVQINNDRYRVNSLEEERRLLAAMMERQQEVIAQAETPKAKAKAQKRKARIAKRIEKIETQSFTWLDQLKQEDEEILMVVG